MKKTIKSTVAVLALSSILFASCGDDNKTGNLIEPESTVSMTLNGGTRKEIVINQYPDTIKVSGPISISGAAKIAKVEVRRSILSIPGSYKVMSIDSTLSVTYTSINVNDAPSPNNPLILISDDKITYLVLVTDSKGKLTKDSVVFVAKPLSFTPSSIILGATANGLNNSKFLGYANNFQSYSTGTDSVGTDQFGKKYKPARNNSNLIDFVFYSNIPDPNVRAAIYSPNYPFVLGAGWNAEIATWPIKRNTQFIQLGSNFSISQFNNASDPSNSAVILFLRGLKFDGNDVNPSDNTIKLAAPTNKIAKLKDQEVIAFKSDEGKLGLMLIAKVPTNDINGNFEVQIKMLP